MSEEVWDRYIKAKKALMKDVKNVWDPIARNVYNLGTTWKLWDAEVIDGEEDMHIIIDYENGDGDFFFASLRTEDKEKYDDGE